MLSSLRDQKGGHVIDGETVAYSKKQEVKCETLNRNRKHFSQATGTPFTIFPLSEVGTTATKFKTAHLPDGTPVQMPADTFLETATILDLLKSPSGSTEFPYQLAHHSFRFQVRYKSLEGKDQHLPTRPPLGPLQTPGTDVQQPTH
jgi:hypothetical protein